ncbi:hypothetical protein CABS01_16981 [Colletotrichum abscissum]|uniref:uncharacterized protein n=1 Tax=Colletotrichum abscissum TaxID=1671311 RepID=UPI0027D52B2E|nr:uncharacterized protein CABS01_16981 [Colletotrichum abscissum]KAK1501458.1 hypothetical protein CABS01_16981 [Colletotrichum abscissum]
MEASVHSTLATSSSQKLERVVHDATQTLCDEFPTHCGCSQSDIRTEYSIYRPDVTSEHCFGEPPSISVSSVRRC